jgi:hypothetical protein
VLKTIAQKRSSDDIVKFLVETVFKPAGSTREAGAGTGLVKKTKER